MAVDGEEADTAPWRRLLRSSASCPALPERPQTASARAIARDSRNCSYRAARSCYGGAAGGAARVSIPSRASTGGASAGFARSASSAVLYGDVAKTSSAASTPAASGAPTVRRAWGTPAVQEEP